MVPLTVPDPPGLGPASVPPGSSVGTMGVIRSRRQQETAWGKDTADTTSLRSCLQGDPQPPPCLWPRAGAHVQLQHHGKTTGASGLSRGQPPRVPSDQERQPWALSCPSQGLGRAGLPGLQPPATGRCLHPSRPPLRPGGLRPGVLTEQRCRPGAAALRRYRLGPKGGMCFQ